MQGKHGNKARIQHMIDAITKINTYVGNISKEAFESNTLLQDACIRQLQILGEAARKTSKNFQNNNDKIPWSEVTGLRNIVIHDYAGVDSDVIWNIIQNDLSPLLQELEIIEAKLPDEEG